MIAKRHKVAVIPGDGIGQEVIPAALSVLEPVAGRHGFSLDVTEFPWGCAYYTKHGRMMAADAYDQLAEFPAIYFGAVGDPSVPDHIAVWELILPLRQRFDQYRVGQRCAAVAQLLGALGGALKRVNTLIKIREQRIGALERYACIVRERRQCFHRRLHRNR